MLKGFKPRLYQQTILDTCTRDNTLVVLPTGLGKTGVAMMLAAKRLQEFPDSKIVLLAPTKPLVQQHKTTFTSFLDVEEEEMEFFTGEIPPDRRQKLWLEKKIVFSTPQGFENDLITNRISLEDVSLIVFDEAHRAVGEYAYVFVAKQYRKQARKGLVLALTASPGANAQKIKDVCSNLFIKEIELRTDEDPDVQPYVKGVDVKRLIVNLPESFASVSKYLKDCFKSKLQSIKNFGYLSGRVENYTRSGLLELQRGMQARMAGGERDFNLMKSLSLLAEAMKVQHALLLVETQGLDSTVAYMSKLQEQAKSSKTKAVKNLVKDINFRSALIKAQNLLNDGEEHPKILGLKKIVSKTLENNKNAKIIVFNQYRDQIVKIKSVLDGLGVTSEVFVGQMKKGETGMSQKEQKACLERFTNNEFSVLLATSVAEEGLDIPAVDLVVFYEPIPSGIRSVQRRGRTGRQDKGTVIVMITKGTLDEAYSWSAHHKEKKMVKAIKKIKNDFNPEYEKKLDDYIEEKLTIFADHREKGSGVLKELSLQGVNINMKAMDVGDYLLGKDLCIEFKTVSDFVDSVIDGRLLEQLKSLRQYRKPMVLIEGQDSLYTQRRIHPNAIRGMLATIMLNYSIPVFQTKDSKDTAALLILLAKRELERTTAGEFQFHSSKPLTLKERQEFIISALPGIGNKLAKPLLEEFGSVKKVVNAKEENLKKIDLIGSKKAMDIRDLLDSDYNP